MNTQDKISKYLGEAMSGDDQIESFFAAAKKKWRKKAEEKVWEWADGVGDSAVGRMAKKFGLGDDEVRDAMLELEIVNPDGEIESDF